MCSALRLEPRRGLYFTGFLSTYSTREARDRKKAVLYLHCGTWVALFECTINNSASLGREESRFRTVIYSPFVCQCTINTHLFSLGQDESCLYTVF